MPACGKFLLNVSSPRKASNANLLHCRLLIDGGNLCLLDVYCASSSGEILPSVEMKDSKLIIACLEPVQSLDQGMQCKAKLAGKTQRTLST
jgi:hypothetical protein